MKFDTLFDTLRKKPNAGVWRNSFITIAVILLGVVAAIAARPTVQIVPAEPGVLPDAISGCGFDIGFTPTSNKEKLTTFYDQNGNVRFMTITGSRKLTIVNLSTGKTIDLNISGPARLEQNPDGSFLVMGGGPAVGVFAPGVAPGLPRVAYTTGRLVLITDENLNPIQVLSVNGTVKDVCTLLS